MRQIGFGFLRDFKKEFGGNLLVGKRKTARPLSTKSPIHLILKSSGSSCFNPGNRKLESLIRNHANKYGIKIYRISLNWSHIHMVFKIPSYKAYISLILSWGKQFKTVIEYHELNDLEAWGLISRKKKKSKEQKKLVFL